MSIQFLRGNTASNDAYTGPVGSLTIDTQLGNIRVHDGTTAGGWVIANIDEVGQIESISADSPIQISGTTENPVISIQAATTSQDGYMSSTDKSKLDGIEAGAEVNTVAPSDLSDFETTSELNARDTANRSRSNHTGTQAASTISDFTSASVAVIEAGNWDVDFGSL